MVKTAGMTNGTPAWQLDRMYETETAEMLERAFGEDDFPALDVAGRISLADYHIGQAISKLCEAANVADKYGRAKRIDELIESLEDYRSDMNAVRRKLEGKG